MVNKLACTQSKIKDVFQMAEGGGVLHLNTHMAIFVLRTDMS